MADHAKAGADDVGSEGVASPSDDAARWEEGGCHCGAIRFRVRPCERRVLECNCSICKKKGFLGLIVPAEDFELLRGEDALVDYRFNTRIARHRFCSTCGIHPFSRPRSHPDSFDVNLRCLDRGVGSFEIVPFDGQHWEESVDSIRKASSVLIAWIAPAMALGVMGFLGAMNVACDSSFVVAGPTRECSEVATQCVLPDGPLGVCEQIPCTEGTPEPCFVCTPQH